jgi:hypothetical protein
MIDSNDASVNKDLATARTPLVEQGRPLAMPSGGSARCASRQRNKRRCIDGS